MEEALKEAGRDKAMAGAPVLWGWIIRTLRGVGGRGVGGLNTHKKDFMIGSLSGTNPGNFRPASLANKASELKSLARDCR